ncbi:MAG: rRNA maturation RNase YbeY [Candidatus Magasanikbacteria bacterium]|nr:rRNA maturation RNase YbeY [Candidatus Magasanikbacteria bacterium]MCA9391195.1 rRNA maturation RNase YbeY [Candidatus Magasanikbacteria bacterium]USN52132.1 MAG: rRNA maturation RNase YbeY [Candidatus Nomurabacteria bacterium]HPF95027.1 rRNA maturation RNase YbeY [bacterium]
MIQFTRVTALPKVLSERDITRAAELLSKKLKIRKATLVSLSFVTPKRIQTLNKQYRKINKPTDVLSFNADPAMQSPVEFELGDIVICPSYATREAKRRAISAREELLRLMIHGVLHLKGYDHATEDEEMVMFRLQEELLERIMNV